jgi:hypothetical protein
LAPRSTVESIVSASVKFASQAPPALNLKPGELVRVRSAAEIFATLDESCALEGVPFMPEMLKYCGRVLPVGQRADTTCSGQGDPRRMLNTVHLQRVRCDGSAHGGCQAACLMFWKEAWLERAENDRSNGSLASTEEEEPFVAEKLGRATKAATGSDPSATRYRCQATEIPNASELLRIRQVGQYVRGVRSWKLPKIVKGLLVDLFNRYQSWSEARMPERLRVSQGRPYPFVAGPLEKGECPPSGGLDLRPGDLVRIKSKREIVATLDKTNRHRGLFVDGELTKYCGRTARVLARVNRLIDEKTGEMIEIKSDCIILDGVVCTGDYHRFCTRAIYSYWREIWLEKIDSPDDVAPTAPCVDRWSRGA